MTPTLSPAQRAMLERLRDPYREVGFKGHPVSLHGPDQLTAYELVEMGMAELVSRDEFGAWFRAVMK